MFRESPILCQVVLMVKVFRSLNPKNNTMSYQDFKLIEDFIDKKNTDKQSKKIENEIRDDKKLFIEYQLHLDLHNLMKEDTKSEELKSSLEILREKNS